MSQKVRIERVSITGGTPFLGMSGTGDDAVPVHSRDPEKVMGWLCAGWRFRFNQYRSRRSKRTPDGSLVPIGSVVDAQTDGQARKAHSWLASMPSRILESTQRLERTEWFAAAERRKTMRSKGKKAGRMPRFRSAQRQDQIFTCWHVNGDNAVFEQVNRNHGIIHIRGQNLRQNTLPGEPSRFSIRVHVRTSQPIRPYTSVQVNWTKKQLVFTNPPLPIERTATGSVIGVDRGVKHNLADSNGGFYDLPTAELKKLDTRVRRTQKAQARAVKAAGHAHEGTYRKSGKVSKRFQARQQSIAADRARATRIVENFQHQWTTQLIRDHDRIGIEKLDVASMVRRAKPVPDPLREGKFLPNGQAAKRGLNRVLAGAAMGRIGALLRYKADLAGIALAVVNARNTSRECNKCHHIDEDNRKSQAVFHCLQCGHTANADTNAALNILDRALAAWAQDASGGTATSRGRT